jgi:adenylate kinase
MALNLIMLGPPGAGKGTQAERFARTRGIPKISTGDILRDAVHTGTEVGKRAKAVMDRGELVGDDVMIGIVKERLDRPDAAAGFVLEGFPRTVAQATALDCIMTGRDPLIVVDIAVPEAELVRRLASRLICEDCGANAAMEDRGDGPPGVNNRGEGAPGVNNETNGDGADRVVLPGANANAPETIAAVRAITEPHRCRRCGGRLVQRSDDNDAIVRERLKVYQRQSEPLVEFYRERPTFRSINGAQPPDRVAADLTAAVEATGVRPPVGTRVLPGKARSGAQS